MKISSNKLVQREVCYYTDRWRFPQHVLRLQYPPVCHSHPHQAWSRWRLHLRPRGMCCRNNEGSHGQVWGTGEWVTIVYATVWVHAYTTHLSGDNIACVVMMFTNPNLVAQLVDALRRVLHKVKPHVYSVAWQCRTHWCRVCLMSSLQWLVGGGCWWHWLVFTDISAPTNTNND